MQILKEKIKKTGKEKMQRKKKKYAEGSSKIGKFPKVKLNFNQMLLKASNTSFFPLSVF